jgi:hypothetical protein
MQARSALAACEDRHVRTFMRPYVEAVTDNVPWLRHMGASVQARVSPEIVTASYPHGLPWPNVIFAHCIDSECRV